MRGLVFNIQKFSLHDGPGIRTVVFLKGCPLRCFWCSNPESQALCEQMLGNEMCGEWRSLSDVLDACMRDAPFYEESGGGVTLSGGEPLMQPDFSAALLDALRERGIHTAIETTGCAAPDGFDRVCGRADLLLFDVKHWDAERHLRGTGAASAPIVANLRRAIAGGMDVLPRIPVIRGYNDAPGDAEGFTRLLLDVGATRAQLLPFHQFGEHKYELLGMEYAYADASPLSEGDLGAYRDALIRGGIDAFF